MLVCQHLEAGDHFEQFFVNGGLALLVEGCLQFFEEIVPLLVTPNMQIHMIMPALKSPGLGPLQLPPRAQVPL